MVLGYATVVDIAMSRLPLLNIGFVPSAVRIIKKNPTFKPALSNALEVILQAFTRILLQHQFCYLIPGIINSCPVISEDISSIN